MLYISIATYHRLPVASREKCIQLNDMNALYATQALEIYDVIKIHIQVSDFQEIAVTLCNFRILFQSFDQEYILMSYFYTCVF